MSNDRGYPDIPFPLGWKRSRRRKRDPTFPSRLPLNVYRGRTTSSCEIDRSQEERTKSRPRILSFFFSTSCFSAAAGGRREGGGREEEGLRPNKYFNPFSGCGSNGGPRHPHCLRARPHLQRLALSLSLSSLSGDADDHCLLHCDR